MSPPKECHNGAHDETSPASHKESGAKQQQKKKPRNSGIRLRLLLFLFVKFPKSLRGILLVLLKRDMRQLG
ncbi:hypothetical protein JTE90_023147 [Oedothorax gibbosus]|uniref:Uncharacterized protein n=1 Tax=Oedothorax gibbosus TaxID=931172 RepID=A0AAV6US74_9ARAC|nr:hypothetical protein JTE90_023147 [Oedothorax gibbosus]